MTHVAACLWKGEGLPAFSQNQYGPEYVENLKSGLERHWPDADLTLFTDGSWDLPGFNQRMLSKGWPGWWKRFEVFDPSAWPDDGRRIVLLDLDLILVGDCSWVGTWADSSVGMPRDPFFPKVPTSTVTTADREGAGIIWEAAKAKNPDDYRYLGAPSEMILLRELAKKHGWAFLENEPRRILSYKGHVQRGTPWTDASIVFFHGKPKPHDLDKRDVLRHLWDAH